MNIRLFEVLVVYKEMKKIQSYFTPDPKIGYSYNLQIIKKIMTLTYDHPGWDRIY